jgi:4,5-epoxidase
MRRTAVLIAGAGPTGLTLACALRMREVAVTVIDAADGPATTSRALGLQPRGVEVLNRVGALGDLPARALPALDMTVHLGSSRPIRIPIGEPGKAAALLISQAKIEGRLRDRLAEPWSGANQTPGVQVAWAHTLVAAETDADGVTAEVRSPDGIVRIRADWLVGCDGAHSAVRKLAGIGFSGDAVMENVLLADVRADWSMSRTGSAMWITPERNVGVIPLPDDSWRLFTALDDGGGRGVGRREGTRHQHVPFDRRDDSGGQRRMGVDLPRTSATGRPISRGAAAVGRRRRAHPQPGRWPGHEHGDR